MGASVILLFFLVFLGVLQPSFSAENDSALVWPPKEGYYCNPRHPHRNFNCRTFTLNVEYITTAPDCVTKKVVGINGQYPGPTLKVWSGQRVQITVINKLPDHPVVLHWHGMQQRQTQWADGVAHGTQCPIPYNGTYVYDFTPGTQFGTYWYHGHISLLRTSLYGLLVVEPPPRHRLPRVLRPVLSKVSKREHKLLINDWFWQSVDDLEAGLNSPKSLGLLGPKANFLINGRGRTDCTDPERMAVCAGALKVPKCPCNAANPSCALSVLSVTPGKKYRLRIVNVALYASLNLRIQGHTMTVVEMDGHYIKPVTVTSLDTHPGMAFSVIIYAKQPVGNYWIQTFGMSDSYGSGFAILRYEGAAAVDPPVPLEQDPLTVQLDPTSLVDRAQQFAWDQQWSFRSAKRVFVKGVPLSQLTPTKRFVIRWARNRVQLADGTVLTGRYSVNNVSFILPQTPLAYADLFKVPGVFDLNPTLMGVKPPLGGIPFAEHATRIFSVNEGDVVEIVFQNNNPPGLVHPWHLHGYEFFVVARGGADGLDFDLSKPLGQQDAATTQFNFWDPQQRNIVHISQNQWVAVRFLADNPGMWNMHCHLEPHMHNGMQTFLRVVPNISYPGPPLDFPKCGKVV